VARHRWWLRDLFFPGRNISTGVDHPRCSNRGRGSRTTAIQAWGRSPTSVPASPASEKLLPRSSSVVGNAGVSCHSGSGPLAGVVFGGRLRPL